MHRGFPEVTLQVLENHVGLLQQHLLATTELIHGLGVPLADVPLTACYPGTLLRLVVEFSLFGNVYFRRAHGAWKRAP